MLSKFIFSLLDFILLLIVSVMLAFLPVWNYLFGSGTPLKACTMPPLWASDPTDERHPVFGFTLINKIYDRSSGNRPTVKIGLPFQAGATQSPSGLYA